VINENTEPYSPPIIRLHYTTPAGEAREVMLDNRGEELAIMGTRPQNQPKNNEQPKTKPQPKKADCKTCGAKGLKRLLTGGAKLLKAELGIDAASDEEQAQRRAACETCDHYDFGVCNDCGCFCAAKIKLKSESCNIGEW